MKLENLNLQQANRLAELKAEIKRNDESHATKVKKLREEMNKDTMNFEVEKVKKYITTDEKERHQGIVNELRSSKECFSMATQCCERLKNIFASLGPGLVRRIMWTKIWPES